MSGKRQKIQDTQMRLAFAEESRGEAQGADGQGTEPRMVKRNPESPAGKERLMEEVCDRKNLEIAWKRVRRNKGGQGVDGMTIEETREYLKEHWPTIREQLLEGTYSPQPVKRVNILKPDGGVRKLGVPCVLDRLIQQGLLQVLQKRWDPTFSEHSYGFRPVTLRRAIIMSLTSTSKNFSIELTTTCLWPESQHGYPISGCLNSSGRFLTQG